MWIEQHKSIGRVKQGTKHLVAYQFQGPVPEEFKVEKLEASCGCTKPKFNRSTGALTASFTAPNVPQHLVYKNEYTTTKKIILHTSVGKLEFTFRATIFIK